MTVIDSQLAAQKLLGLRILLVEDEMMLAMMLEDMLTDLGYRVVLAGRIAKAVQLAASEAIDGAILDMNVAGESVYPVAQELRTRGIPFIFATGYGPQGVDPRYQSSPVLTKPYHVTDLKRVAAATFGLVGGGSV
jgi:CheY-like chemotaxis protein